MAHTGPVVCLEWRLKLVADAAKDSQPNLLANLTTPIIGRDSNVSSS